jgi:hypothetical protein
MHLKRYDLNSYLSNKYLDYNLISLSLCHENCNECNQQHCHSAY